MRTLALALAALLALCGLAAGANGAAAPVNLFMGFGANLLDESGKPLGNNPARGEPFFIYVYVGTAGNPGTDNGPNVSEPRTATYALQLPRELTIGGPQTLDWPSLPDNERTTSTCVTACRVDLPAGIKTRGFYYKVSASASGVFAIFGRITSADHPDPDDGDNQTTWSLKVGTGSETQKQVTAGALISTPATPRAGAPFSIMLPLTRGTAGVRPSSVSCKATLAGTPLAGASARLRRGARCGWRIPADSRGHKLKAALTAMVGGETYSARRTAVVR